MGFGISTGNSTPSHVSDNKSGILELQIRLLTYVCYVTVVKLCRLCDNNLRIFHKLKNTFSWFKEQDLQQEFFFEVEH